MQKHTKGQVSVELMVIIGVVLILIIPSILFVFNYIKSDGDEDFGVSQGYLMASRIEHSINMVGSTGTGSALKTEIQMPYNFRELITEEDELVVRLHILPGQLDVVRVTDYKIISTNLNIVKPTGSYILEISAINETHVNVSLS
ncbi:hypothetical protein KO317_01695 [Candidatus Micrarchaeota archaeon]|nr:hypothetical protein [Candidatus Micrarchaeota archaeon]